MRSLLFCLLLACAALAQVKPANPDFEEGQLGAVPSGWFVPPMVAQAGFQAALVGEGCRSGARCAMITGVANHPSTRTSTS